MFDKLLLLKHLINWIINIKWEWRLG